MDSEKVDFWDFDMIAPPSPKNKKLSDEDSTISGFKSQDFILMLLYLNLEICYLYYF